MSSIRLHRACNGRAGALPAKRRAPTGAVAMRALLMRLCLSALPSAFAVCAEPLPETVTFPSRDGATTLTGYLFKPSTPPPWPGVVMLHGRSGPYSTAVKGRYDASALSQRHREWGWFWAGRGYLALHVDSFGPRGHAAGFPVRSYSDRPSEVNEQTVRPLDAYGAAAHLRQRGDTIPDRIGLHGWSNGAMAGLAALARDAPGLEQPTPESGFRAALLFYPGCRDQQRQDDYAPYAPALVLLASEDEEVNPRACRDLIEQVRARGFPQMEYVWYAGATHAFDENSSRRRAVEGNRRARPDAFTRAEAFFERYLRR